MKYQPIDPIARTDAEKAFDGEDPEKMVLALLGLALHDPDWRYVQEKCLRFLKHEDRWVRGAAAISLGHIARLHKTLDDHLVVPALTKLVNDPDMGGIAEDALDDIRMYMPKGAA